MKRRPQEAILLVITISLLCLVMPAGCRQNPPQAEPYWPTQDWQTTTPEEQGMDGKLLSAMFTALKQENIYSAVIVRNGFLITASALNTTLQVCPQGDQITSIRRWSTD